MAIVFLPPDLAKYRLTIWTIGSTHQCVASRISRNLFIKISYGWRCRDIWLLFVGYIVLWDEWLVSPRIKVPPCLDGCWGGLAHMDAIDPAGGMLLCA